MHDRTDLEDAPHAERFDEPIVQLDAHHAAAAASSGVAGSALRPHGGCQLRNVFVQACRCLSLTWNRLANINLECYCFARNQFQPNLMLLVPLLLA